ncbi:MAG: zinc-binding dehydrogenase [Saprospiraceae bacterium]|nr:zinc-binding dehydrogenase [Saprospiraceae bacterium]
MSIRKVYRVKPGNISNLSISEEFLADPEDGQAQIKVRSIGLNFADLYAVWGLYSATPEGKFIPGLEVSGTVIKTKPGSRFKAGDRVMAVTKFGAYSDHINLDESYIIRLPDAWSFDEGAAFLVQVLTAYYALFELGNLKSDQMVLIHSGAGGVGHFANWLAKSVGATTIGTTASEEKVDKMLGEGYDYALVRTPSFKKDLTKIIADRSLSLILECIGGKILKEGFDLLAPQGRMIVYGAANFTTNSDRPNYLKMGLKYLFRPKIDPMSLPTTNRSIMGFNLIYLYDQVDLMHQMLAKISSINLPKPVIGKTFVFAALPEALRSLRSGRTVGKVIVNCPE